MKTHPLRPSPAALARAGILQSPLLFEFLLFLQLVVSGTIGFSFLIASDRDLPGPLAGVFFPLRSVVTVSVILLIIMKGRRLTPSFRMLSTFLFALFLIASATWSVDFGYTFRAALDFTLFLLSISLLTSGMTCTRFANVVLNVFCFASIISFVFSIAVPSVGITSDVLAYSSSQVGLWKGTFVEKNGLGGSAALGLAMMSGLYRQWSAPAVVKIMGLSSALFCFMFSGSSTSFLGIATIIFFAVALHGSPSNARVLTIFILIVATVILSITTPIPQMLVEALGGDPTFANRTYIWEETINTWRQSPLLGFGYSAGTGGVLLPYLVDVIGLAARHAHSSYLEIMIDCGLVGLFVFVLFFVSNMIYACCGLRKISGDSRNSLYWIILILLGSTAMGFGDVLAWRLIGGWGVITWAAIAWISSNSIGPPSLGRGSIPAYPSWRFR